MGIRVALVVPGPGTREKERAVLLTAVSLPYVLSNDRRKRVIFACGKVGAEIDLKGMQWKVSQMEMKRFRVNQHGDGRTVTRH